MTLAEPDARGRPRQTSRTELRLAASFAPGGVSARLGANPEAGGRQK